MLGSIKAILYRNFWLSYKMNLLSLVFIIWGILNCLTFSLPISLMYCILVFMLHLQQQSLYTHSMVDDRYSNFKIIYNIMGLKKSLYVVAQALSFILQGLVINCLLFGIGMGYNFYYKQPMLAPFDSRLFVMAFFYLLVITFYAISLSFIFKNPTISKDLSVASNVLVLYLSIYLVVKDALPFLQPLSPYTYLIRFCRDFLDNMRDPTYVPDLTPGLYYMLIQAAVFFVLSVYLENVAGGDDEHRKHPLFFLQCLVGRGRKQVRNISNDVLTEGYDGDAEIDRNGLTVINLSKKFGNFRALNGINVNFTAGKMHCMLGHNGAGKSTFINILTGFYGATEGRMVYMGENLMDLHRSESDKINIGICPPNDILFPSLTLYQHLKMMVFIKGLTDGEQRITDIMRQINVTEYAGFKVSELSGGNKRKLTIAISLIGSPNLLFLDEPTSALDPVSRKDIWRILQEVKAERPRMITILTTHHLEEAETLADNIVVLAAGAVKVKGSIDEIKKAFGIGYTFEVVSQDPVAPEQFHALIASVNAALESPLIRAQDLELSDRKMEIKISLSQAKNIVQLVEALRRLLPSTMFFTVNSNTLEKAYIQIDKDLHHDSTFNDRAHLPSVLRRLYNPRKAGTFEVLLAVLINKLQFLTSNFMEVFKLVANYTIMGSTMGFMVYYAHHNDAAVRLGDLKLFFGFMIFLEIIMSSFSVFNLVYDKSKDLKFMLFVNKVAPSVYFAGKLLADFLVISAGYSAIFGVFYLLLREDFAKTEEDLQAVFFLLAFKVYAWRLTYACVGMLYYRLFDNTRSALTYYPLVYLGIYLVILLLCWQISDAFAYLNDLSLITRVFSDESFGYVKTLVSFAGLSAGHLAIVLFVENRALRFNFLNARIEKRNYFPEGEESVPMDSIDLIQTNLRKTIRKEVEETLSFEPRKLKVIDLKKRYDNGKVALNEVTFNIDKTTQFGLIGPNGAGKSTLFNILLGKVMKTSGSVFMNNVPEYKAFPGFCFQDSPYLYNNYGVCFQGDSMWEQLTVIDNLRFFCRLHSINEPALMELLTYFEFQHYLNKPGAELSSGNKRKLCIIISLLINPNVVLFDEATCGVDLYMRLRLKDIFDYYLKENQSMAIFTTHFLKDIEVFCDKIGIIDRGEFLCIDYIDVIKKNLGGYVLHLSIAEAAQKERILQTLGQHAAVKVTHQDEEKGTLKCLMNKIGNILDVFLYLLALEQEKVLNEFSINQLSIEDIYLDVFNRSE